MHPILARGRRLALYWLWAAVGVLLGVLLAHRSASDGTGRSRRCRWPFSMRSCALGVVNVEGDAARGDRRPPHRRAAVTAASAISSAVSGCSPLAWVDWLARRASFRFGATTGLYRVVRGVRRAAVSAGARDRLPDRGCRSMRAAERQALQVQVLAREAEVADAARADRSTLPLQQPALHQRAHRVGCGIGATHVRAARGLPSESLALGGESRITLARGSGSSRASWPWACSSAEIGCVTRSSSPTRPIEPRAAASAAAARRECGDARDCPCSLRRHGHRDREADRRPAARRRRESDTILTGRAAQAGVGLANVCASDDTPRRQALCGRRRMACGAWS